MKGGRTLLPVWGKWIVVAVGCVIAEIFTPSFYILWFGGGALAVSYTHLDVYKRQGYRLDTSDYIVMEVSVT